MMSITVTVLPSLAQCPCSGGGGGSGSGINQTALLIPLALAVGVWQVVKWTKRTWSTQGTTTMRRFSKIGPIVALAGAVVLDKKTRNRLKRRWL